MLLYQYIFQTCHAFLLMIFHSFEYIVYYLLDYMGFSLSSQGKVLLGPPQAARVQRVQWGKVLKMDGPSDQGFLSLTGLRPEGCGIARRAMSFISRLRRSRQHRVSILSAYLVHPFPLRGTSTQGETRALRDWLSVSYSMISTLAIGSLRSPPPFPLRGTSPYAGGRIKHRETLSS